MSRPTLASSRRRIILSSFCITSRLIKTISVLFLVAIHKPTTASETSASGHSFSEKSANSCCIDHPIHVWTSCGTSKQHQEEQQPSFSSSSVRIIQSLRAGEQRARQQTQPAQEERLSNFALATAGATATMVGDAIMQPMDCIKTFQMSEQGSGMNIWSAAKYIFQNYGGLPGFYSGSLVYCLSDGFAGSLKFVTFEALKQKFMSSSSSFLCAAVAGLVYVAAIVPGELIKQKLQMNQIASASEGILQIYSTSGILGFFTGFTGVCLRAVPYTMIELGLYDWIKKWYTAIIIAKRKAQENNRAQLTPKELIVIASMVGGIAGYLTTPLDNIKTKIMLNSSKYSSTSNNGPIVAIIACARDMIESSNANHGGRRGVRSLFDGGVARVAWLMPFTAIYLPLYESIQRYMLKARSSVH
eukprot:CAMPEP_0196804206 /NCGR_PEP_ID=MMETSP1362-20130617/3757_1 /TAXON_ID=163516 /ORGANISM="Leptocylindrus danicus, Strain CCMP1856" /LENGTH=414 /DNA_ID=CAMNT_0042176333 /DNA_START=346 /DNA_END=1593 /DNA_ORIENTATION=+